MVGGNKTIFIFMKEYLKPYLLPKEYAGKNYICQRCNSEMIVGKDGPSGNRRTFGICKKCKTELGRIEKYGSLENFQKIYHKNLSEACKEKWKNEEYRNNISEKVKESWENEEHRESVSKSVKANWETMDSQEKQKRCQNISKGVSKSVCKTKAKIENFRQSLQEDGKEYLSVMEAASFLGISWDRLKLAKGLWPTPIKIGNYKFFEKGQIQKIYDYLKSLKGRSKEEKEVIEFVKSFYKGRIIENDRKILNGKELDIYLQDEKLAFEFDGLYWHSDRVHLKKGEIPDETQKKAAMNLQLNKTLLCEKQGIRLIHIFEDDWVFQKDKIKNLIKNSLGFAKSIYARKCIVREIDNETYKNFLLNYHLQNYSMADLRLGLFYENELVECIGIRTKGNHVKEPELVRLCTKAGFRVVGGFSKLLAHSGMNCMTSYIDRSVFDGKGYYAVGFTKVRENKPSYFYVKTYFREPRYHYMRKCIEKKFNEGVLEYWNPKETEELNMYKNGFSRVWDCGTIVVRWQK